jgi:CheY-like chemotaxis protein
MQMRRLNILVVEDQAFLALSMGDLVGSLGYRAVGPATTLAQALKLLDTASIDGALLDRDLGGESSTPLANELAQRGIPFAWATAARMPADCPVPVLRKPFTVPELQQTLQALFAARVTA